MEDYEAAALLAFLGAIFEDPALQETAVEVAQVLLDHGVIDLSQGDES